MANVITIVVNARDHTRSALASVRRGIGNMIDSVRNSASGFASTLQGAFSGGLRSALSTPVVGPVIMVAMAGIALTLAPLIATLIGSAIVLGLGGALVGVGVMVAMQNEGLKKRFGQTFGEVKKIAADAFKPLIPVLDTVRGVILDIAKVFGPVIKQAMQLAQAPLQRFAKSLGEAFKALAPAIGPLMAAFTSLLDEIGPRLPGLMKEFSGALIILFNVVGDNAGTFAKFFTFLVWILNTVIVTLAGLIKMWEWFTAALDWAWERLKDLAGIIADAFGAAAEKVKEWFGDVVGAARAFGSRVKSAVRGLWNGVTSALGSIRSRVSGFVGSVVGLARSLYNRVRGAVSGMWNAVTSALGGIRSRVSGFVGSIVGAARSLASRIRGAVSGMWNGIVSGISSAVNAAFGWLNSLWNRAVSIANSIRSTMSSLTSWIPGFATGGVVGAAGGGPRSNLVMVGEQGRELVRLPFGSTVIPHGQTEGMMGGGGGGGRIVLEVHSGGSRLDDVLVEILRNAVRVRGGNVQLALGR